MPFWIGGLGSHTVTFNRYKLLIWLYEEVHVIFIAGNTGINMPFNGYVIRFEDGEISYRSRITDHVNSFGYDILYCQYLFYNDIVANVKCKKVVEIHDVLHLRQLSFEKFDYVAPIIANKEYEIASLKIYDSVICLNNRETAYLISLGVNNVFFIPPNFEIATHTETDRIWLGIIGSSAKPNIDGVQYYLDGLRKIDKLVIAGSLAKEIKVESFSVGLRCLGMLKDIPSFYSELYGALVPVRFGAGVKIKTIESLVNLVPVFSTSHGVEGLPDGIETISCVYDNVSDWTSSAFDLLRAISRNQIEDYVYANFSYTAAAKIINQAF